ncbi:MAG: Uma2 family endonuclease [Acidobacteria bacterium]|nr:Uma2 family endonuclease [Acidobacteriota bacterium]
MPGSRRTSGSRISSVASSVRTVPWSSCPSLSRRRTFSIRSSGTNGRKEDLTHGRAVLYFNDILERHLGRDEDVLVLNDVQLLTGPGRRGPAPDVMVVRGARNPDLELWRFDPVKQRAVPCLAIEVLSQIKALRRADQEDKVQLYQGLGIPDYLLVDPPLSRTGNRFRLQGYHLDPEGSYRPIEPDAQGRLLCASVGLRFGVSAQGDQVEVFDARTGERLLSSREQEEGRKAAKAELERLRAEVRQLKSSGR